MFFKKLRDYLSASYIITKGQKTHFVGFSPFLFAPFRSPYFTAEPHLCHRLINGWKMLYVPTIRAEIMTLDKQKCQILKLIIWEKLPTIQWEWNNLSVDSHHCSFLDVDTIVHSRMLERKHTANSLKLGSRNVP